MIAIRSKESIAKPHTGIRSDSPRERLSRFRIAASRTPRGGSSPRPAPRRSAGRHHQPPLPTVLGGALYSYRVNQIAGQKGVDPNVKTRCRRWLKSSQRRPLRSSKPMPDSGALPKNVPAGHSARGLCRAHHCRTFAAASLGGRSHNRHVVGTKRSDADILPAPKRHAKTPGMAKTRVGPKAPKPVGTNGKFCTEAAAQQPTGPPHSAWSRSWSS
jgi:hypothetical protein